MICPKCDSEMELHKGVPGDRHEPASDPGWYCDECEEWFEDEGPDPDDQREYARG